jgi:hypothetical protein
MVVGSWVRVGNGVVEHDAGGEEDACADEETHLDEAGEA